MTAKQRQTEQVQRWAGALARECGGLGGGVETSADVRRLVEEIQAVSTMTQLKRTARVLIEAVESAWRAHGINDGFQFYLNFRLSECRRHGVIDGAYYWCKVEIAQLLPQLAA